MRDWLGGAAAVLLGFCAATMGISNMAAAEETRFRRSVNVAATGSVSGEPDIAHISTGVVSEAETAREAVSRNTAVMKKVVDGLKAAGVAAKDIQTSSFNVEPRYQHSDDGRPPAIIGYRALNQVHIVARDIAKLGEVLTIAEEVRMDLPRPMQMARAAMAKEAVPIERGTQTLEVKVHVTWALR